VPTHFTKGHGLFSVYSIRGQSGGSAGNIDRYGKSNAHEEILIGRIYEAFDNADHFPITI
jgi:hypothetical protein